jgi:predicted TIM-barrel fold metal-dependent hydrolase
VTATPTADTTAEVAQWISGVPLVDHHVHSTFVEPVTRARFEESINEGSLDPIPPWMTQFDSQLGFAIRAFCSPLLDLEPHAPADVYWTRRTELGERAVAQRMLGAAGVSDWLVDTGYKGSELAPFRDLGSISGSRVHEIVRLESLAELLAAAGCPARDYAEEFRALLGRSLAGAVGAKTVAAYRTGFDIAWGPPTDAEVAAAAGRWLATAGAQPRMDDPTLIAFGVHAAAAHGLPIQVHVGFGDRDLDLHRVDPMLLLELLRHPDIAPVPVTLLHCYPFHRQAGYLTQAFDNVYFDVGVTINYLGARSRAIVAESLELAPFAKILYSSDAWGPAELHYLGAMLWRRAMTEILSQWIGEGHWSAPDAMRVTTMIASENARRIYALPDD